MHHILFLRIRLRTARRPRPARLAAAAVVGVWLLAACSPATPTPTPVPTATPTATATFTPSVTPSPTATATPTFPADALVDVSTLNLRAGPNTLHPIVEVLGLGTPVAVTGRNDDASWLSVRSPAEGTGWINASFVRLRKDEARIPVVATPTSPPTPTATAVPMDPAQPLVLVPPAVALGDPVLVRLRAPGAAQVAAVLGDQQFTLFPCAPDSFAALFGIPPDSNPGEHAVHVTAVDGGGDPVPREVILTVHDARFEAEGIALDESRQRLLDPALKDAETARMGAEVWSVVSPEKRWAGIWTRPVTGTVSSVFGTRRSYNAGALDARHLGVDFRAGSGSPVLAPSRAHVLFAAPIEIGGNTVWLDHGWGVHSGYMHLRDIVVTPGTDVEAGQVLGTVGATGRVTGPHLHWEVRIHGIPVNPLAFLQRDVGQVP